MTGRSYVVNQQYNPSAEERWNVKYEFLRYCNERTDDGHYAFVESATSVSYIMSMKPEGLTNEELFWNDPNKLACKWGTNAYIFRSEVNHKNKTQIFM
jgi:hypothetical protein